jgi:hypothetical protein
MATYKEVIGTAITNIAGDSPTTVNGDVWYNSSTSIFKFNTVLAAAWSTGGALGTSRQQLGGVGTQTAALGFGGEPTTTATEEYNGTAWTGGGALGTARYGLAGAGTQTAGLAFGGSAPPDRNLTEEYNGSSWTAGGI